MWCPWLSVAEAERGAEVAEPWASLAGLAEPCGAPWLTNQGPEAAQSGLQLPGQDGQLLCLAEGDSLLPRAILCFHVLFSWQGLPQAMKVAEEPTHFPLSRSGLIRKHQTHVTRDPSSAGSPSWRVAQHFLMHGGSYLLLFTTAAFPSKTFARESIWRQSTSQVWFYR